MPAWRRILCAVDLSDASRAAVRDAAQLARTCGADLTVLHVSTLVSGTDPFVPNVEELMRQDTKTLEGELQPWKEEAARLAERPVTMAVVHGRPADEIVAFARDRGFDLVVVATHGRSGVRRLVLGSVAEHVVREAPVPVLVVRPPARR